MFFIDIKAYSYVSDVGVQEQCTAVIYRILRIFRSTDRYAVLRRAVFFSYIIIYF